PRHPSTGKRASLREFCAVALVVPVPLIGAGGLASAAYPQDVAAFLAGRIKDCPGCDLSNQTLKRRNLPGANLAGANLAGASFHRSVLRGANLSGADLTGANLNKTDLIQADLSNTKIGMAMLFESDASRANF